MVAPIRTQKLEGWPTLLKLGKITQELIKVDQGMPLQRLLILLSVAAVEHSPDSLDPPTIAHLRHTLGLPQGTVSNNVKILIGESERPEHAAMPALMRKFPNPANYKEVALQLTPEGTRLVRKIISMME